MKRSLCIALLLAACGGAEGPGPAVPPAPTAAPTAPPKEPPPESGPVRDSKFPPVAWAELPNGLRVATIVGKSLPLVHVRIVVFGGRAADSEKPGLADLTARSLVDGGAGPYNSREIVTRIEMLGAPVFIHTDLDRTVIGLSVTKNNLAEAFDLLAALVQGPRFDAGEFERTRRRAVDRTADAARSNGKFGAQLMMYRELFNLPNDRHPYAAFEATPAEIGKLGLNDCRAFHKKYFVPKNTVVVVAGDTSATEVKAAAQHGFVTFRGGDAPVLSFADPMPPDHRRITLVDRPKSSQSEVYVAALGPQRVDKDFAAFDVANQVLGGGMAGRLFREVREKQSLAYSTRSVLHDLAHGPSVLVAHAGTQTPKTGLAVKALLDQFERLGTTTPSQDEVATATRFLSDVTAIRQESMGAVADELVHLQTMGLPENYPDAYKKLIRDIEPAYAGKIAGEHVRAGHEIVVVAGDANAVGPMLSRFGEVRVVDPTKNFDRVRTLPMDPNAKLGD